MKVRYKSVKLFAEAPPSGFIFTSYFEMNTQAGLFQYCNRSDQILMTLNTVKTSTRKQTKGTFPIPRLVRLQSFEDTNIDAHWCYSDLSWEIFPQKPADLTVEPAGYRDRKGRMAPFHGLLCAIVL